MLYTRYLNAAIKESSCLSAAEMYTKRCFCHHGEFLTKVGPFAEEVHSSFRITCLASPAWEEQQKRFCAQKILKHWSKVSLSVFSCTVKFFQVSTLAVQQRFLKKAVSFFFFFNTYSDENHESTLSIIHISNLFWELALILVTMCCRLMPSMK